MATTSASGFDSQNVSVRRPEAVTVASTAEKSVGPFGSSGFIGRTISK
jgi:hypothetical protein